MNKPETETNQEDSYMLKCRCGGEVVLSDPHIIYGPDPDICCDYFVCKKCNTTVSECAKNRWNKNFFEVTEEVGKATFQNRWLKKRRIIEFSQEIVWRGEATNTYWFRRVKKRWQWYTAGTRFEGEGFKTQAEARDAAAAHNAKMKLEVDKALARIRERGIKGSDR